MIQAQDSKSPILSDDSSATDFTKTNTRKPPSTAAGNRHSQVVKIKATLE
jgi:hypothetical protein